MPAAYSMDLRTRILEDVLAGMTYADAARKHKVSAEFVRQFHRRFEATQEIEPRPPINKIVPFHQRYSEQIRTLTQDNPSITLHQLRDKLGIRVSIGTLWNVLQKLKITFKKNFSSD